MVGDDIFDLFGTQPDRAVRPNVFERRPARGRNRAAFIDGMITPN